MNINKIIKFTKVLIISALLQQIHLANAADDTVSIDLKSRVTTVCNLTFQELYYTSNNAAYSVQNSSVKLPGTNYRVIVPKTLLRSAYAVASDPTTKSQVSVSKTSTPSASIPLMGAFPILPTSEMSPTDYQTKFCSYVQQYYNAFKASNVTSLVSNDIVSIKITSGALNVSLPKTTFTLSKTTRTAPKIAVLPDVDTNLNVDYLILVQDLYYSDVQPLATYRTNQGYKVEVKKISTLPGYDANATPPAECTGVYERECYHLFNEPIASGNASKYAVPSFFGMRRQTTIGQTYTRATSMAGIIRAYLRRKKALNPNFKAAFLIGDPAVIPASAYHADGGEPAGLHTGTDLYYAFPNVPLLPNTTSIVSTADEAIYPWMMRCENQTTHVITYRKWCLVGEAQVPWDWVNTWYSPNTPVKRAFPSLPCYGWNNYTPGCIANNANQVIAVGRLATQSVLKPGGKDPAVTNYINKLIYWESHLPFFAGNSIFTFGGAEFWLWNWSDITEFFANYGPTSKIYASQDYISQNSSQSCNSYICPSNCSNCSYKTSDNIIAELSTQTRTAWYLNGHGGHPSIQGTYNTVSPPTSNSFVVGHQYFIDAHGYVGPNGLLQVTGSPNHSVINNMANTNKLIGHVVANSCSPASFSLYSKHPQDMVALDPTAEQASFQENLLNMPNGGAINTFLNVNVGWGYAENAVNRLFMNKVHEAWTQCGRIGDAFIKFVIAEANGDDWALHNRFLGGDPLAKIAKSPLNCNFTTGDPLPNYLESVK